MNDEFLRNFFQLFRPKGLLTRDPGEPRETFEQLQQRALERERAEEAQRAASASVDRDIEGLGDNELAAGRAAAVPPHRVNPLAEAADATPARPEPAVRRRDDDLRIQNAVPKPTSRDIRRRDERRAAAQ